MIDEYYVQLQIAFQYTFDDQLQTAYTHTDWVWRNWMSVSTIINWVHTVFDQDQIVMAWTDMGHRNTLVDGALHILKSTKINHMTS